MLKVNKTLWDHIHIFVKISVNVIFKKKIARAVDLARAVMLDLILD